MVALRTGDSREEILTRRFQNLGNAYGTSYLRLRESTRPRPDGPREYGSVFERNQENISFSPKMGQLSVVP